VEEVPFAGLKELVAGASVEELVAGV